MSEAAIQRLEREIETLHLRVREVSNLDTPMTRQLNDEVRGLRHKIDKMDVEGTHITQVRLKNIEEDLREIKEDAKSVRVTVRSALITAALSLGVQLILFAILRSQT